MTNLSKNYIQNIDNYNITFQDNCTIYLQSIWLLLMNI